MLDQVGLSVADFETSKAFYAAALKPLGLSLLEASFAERGADSRAAFGAPGRPCFWIASGDGPKGGAHVAFAAATRAEVEAWHRAALAAGGRDAGPPGVRPRRHAQSYVASVLDPDGNIVEAVCHRPAWTSVLGRL